MNSRIMILMQQSRYDLAEQELRQYLAQNMDDAHCHALLAFCLNQLKRYEEAQEVVGKAIALDPEHSFSFYVLARIKISLKDLKAGREAIDQAIRLAPEESEYYGMLALIYLQAQRWQQALDAANEGLRFDPTDQDCLNFRSMALTKLNRHDEAQQSIHQTLRENPQNEMAHANIGWAALHRGDHKAALEHFSEALHINPNLDWARMGLVEALKARYWIYRIILKFFLWMTTLPPQYRVGLIFGLFILMRALDAFSERNPALTPFIQPVLTFYMFFVLLTWLAVPLFNWIIGFNKFGRHALSKSQKNQGVIFGLFFISLLLSIAAGFVTHIELFFQVALCLGILIIPSTHVFNHMEKGIPVRAVLYVVALGLTGIGWLVASGLGRESLSSSLFGLFILGFVFYTWAGSLLGLKTRAV